MVDLAGSSDPAESYFRLQPTHRCRPAAVANLCGELGPFRGRRDVRRETVFARANAAARFPTLPAATHRNGSGAALPLRGSLVAFAGSGCRRICQSTDYRRRQRDLVVGSAAETDCDEIVSLDLTTQDSFRIQKLEGQTRSPSRVGRNRRFFCGI